MRLALAAAAGAALALYWATREAPTDQGGSNPAEEIIDAGRDIVEGTAAKLFGTKYDSLIYASAQQAGIDPAVLYRLLYRESHFRADIIDGRKRSKVGALGIAQFMPETAAQWCGSVEGALNPSIAIPAAARYLAYLIAYFGGDLQKGVAAYNWGMGNVQRKGLARAPEETRQYVLDITQEEIAA